MAIRTQTIRSKKSLLYKPTINRINKFLYDLKNNTIEGKKLSWWLKRKLKIAIKNKDIDTLLDLGETYFNENGGYDFELHEIITSDNQVGYELMLYGISFVFV